MQTTIPTSTITGTSIPGTTTTYLPGSSTAIPVPTSTISGTSFPASSTTYTTASNVPISGTISSHDYKAKHHLYSQAYAGPGYTGQVIQDEQTLKGVSPLGVDTHSKWGKPVEKIT